MVVVVVAAVVVVVVVVGSSSSSSSSGTMMTGKLIMQTHALQTTTSPKPLELWGLGAANLGHRIQTSVRYSNPQTVSPPP